MVRLITSPRVISAAGKPPKHIEEFIGRAASGTEDVSIARMRSPPGWSEPGQAPLFDEYTLVLRGSLCIATRDRAVTVLAGQVAVVPKGEWVQYSTPGGAEYVAVCLPAFSEGAARRDLPGPSGAGGR
jgi:mannose-6-phosphate isomerase-like protein (cupin superfamily)